MFTTLIVQPIFNLLALIYALLPGHNFGMALIIFTVIVRLALWPLVKKQLHQAKLMRKIQPDLRRIAQETKGNRQKQAQLQMELYKEKGINPFASIGVALLQLPILIGLYIGLQKVVKDPHQMVDFAYPFIQNLPWMQHLEQNIHLFDATLFGIVDLTRSAIGPQGFYLPAFLIVTASAVTQYFQAKQLMPSAKDARKLRDILKDAGQGKQADQQEVSAAIGRSTQYFLPAMVFFFTLPLASALGLYWFVGSLVAFIQQSIVLREDQEEMEDLSERKGAKVTKKSGRDTAKIPEAEVVGNPGKSAKSSSKATASKSKPFVPRSGSTVTNITRSSNKPKRR